jgi:hypothetical protein
MRMPDMMPARTRAGDRSMDVVLAVGAVSFAASSEMTLQGDPLKCALCCSGKAGFGACVATCIATGMACDGGYQNCTSCS